MRKYRFLSLILAGFLSCQGAFPALCTEILPSKDKDAEEVVVTYQEDTPDEETQKIIDSGYSLLPAYFTDEQFDELFSICVDRYNSGEETSVYTLLQTVLSRAVTLDQIHKILDQGYLTEYIDDFKKSQILEKDYKLPEGVEIHPTPKIHSETATQSYADTHKWSEDPDKTYIHDVTETASSKAQQVMVDLLQDEVVNNAYIMCPADSSDKRIWGQMLEISAFRGEPLLVLFMEPEKEYALYSWYFPAVAYMNRDYLDLNIDYDGKTLKFDLGDTLPKPAMITLYTGQPYGTIVNLKEHNGDIAYSLPVDEDGFIKIPDVYRSGDYNISNEYVQKDDGKQKDESTQSLISRIHVPGVSNIGILIIILILIAAGTVFAALGIMNARSRGHSGQHKKHK